MKNLLTLVLVCAVAATASAGMYGTNLLANPSFEDWDTADGQWVTVWNQNPASAVGTEDEALSGSRSLQVTSPYETGWNNGEVNQQFSVSYNAGDILQASVWVKVQDWIGDGLRFRVVLLGAGPQVINSSFVNNASDWTEITLEHVFTSDYDGDIRFDLRYYHDNAQETDPAIGYFDDASLVVVPEPMTMGLLGLGGLALIRKRK